MSQILAQGMPSKKLVDIVVGDLLEIRAMSPEPQSSEEKQPSSQSMDIRSSQLSGVTLGQAGRDVIVTHGADSSKQDLQPEDVVAILNELKALLSATDIPPEEKQMSVMSVELAQKEAQKEKPNKSFIAELLKRVTQVSKDATDVIDAGSGFWEKAKPIIEKLLPYLGIGLTFFA